jgi:hypothetical protein
MAGENHCNKYNSCYLICLSSLEEESWWRLTPDHPMCQSDCSKAQGTSGLSRSKHLCRRSAGSLGEGIGHFAQTGIGTAGIQLNFGLLLAIGPIGNTQFGVTPDGSPVFTRDIGTTEIYALTVKWP